MVGIGAIISASRTVSLATAEAPVGVSVVTDFVEAYTVAVARRGIMCQVCAIVSENIGFNVCDDREYRYLILYAFVCMIKVNLDMTTTYIWAMCPLGGLGFRTYENRRTQIVSNLTEKF